MGMDNFKALLHNYCTIRIISEPLQNSDFSQHIIYVSKVGVHGHLFNYELISNNKTSSTNLPSKSGVVIDELLVMA